MSANETQVGGNHYKKLPYQHWDLVVDTNMHYLIGGATKYVARWRDKNGEQDLIKAKHYLKKADENNTHIFDVDGCAPYFIKFSSQLDPVDALIINYILVGDHDRAVGLIDELIADIGGANEHYTNQG